MAVICLGLVGVSFGQSFSFDGTGRLKVNTTGSSNLLVSVTNTLTTTVADTTKIGVTNVASTYLWAATTNSQTVSQIGTNAGGTYIWAAITNSVATTGGANNSTNVGVVGSVAVTNITGGYLWVATTNSQTIAQIGTNAGGTYIWTAQTNAIPAGSAVIGAVTQSGTWNDGVTNSPGTYLWVATTNSQTVAQIGTNASGTYIWTAQTNAIPTGANVIGAVTQSGTWNVGTLTTFPDNEPFNLAQIGGQAPGVALPVTNGPTALTVQPGNTANTTPWLVSEIPATSGGLSMFTANPGAVVYSNIVKASAGQVYHISVMNSNSAAISVKLYNTATAFNPGTLTPVWNTMVPGNTAGAGYVVSVPDGLAFSTGIGIGATLNIATNDTTALTAGQTLLNVGFK